MKMETLFMMVINNWMNRTLRLDFRTWAEAKSKNTKNNNQSRNNNKILKISSPMEKKISLNKKISKISMILTEISNTKGKVQKMMTINLETIKAHPRKNQNQVNPTVNLTVNQEPNHHPKAVIKSPLANHQAVLKEVQHLLNHHHQKVNPAEVLLNRMENLKENSHNLRNKNLTLKKHQRKEKLEESE